MASQGQSESRATVDWSFPMTSAHLPPKSPGSFPSLAGAGGSGGDSKRAGGHKRTPSAGYLPQAQATWMEGVVDTPETSGAFKRGAHRRSSSESMAFLDGHTNFSKMIEDTTGTEDDDYESRSVASLHSGGHSGSASASVDFDSENAQHQWGQPRASTKQMEQPATPSDSNSVASEVSNEDTGMKVRNKSDADVQSSGEGGVTQTFSKTELQAALAGLDSSLDPKRAKRILANRQSAQRSRVRKLQYISELERSVTALQSEVSTMAPQVAFFEHRRVVLNVDNNSIKQKMAALLQGQRFKDAHNEALQKEVQRLRQLYQHQQHQMQQQQPQHLQSNAATSEYDRHQGESSIGAVPDIFANPTDTTMSTGSVSPTHPRSRSLPHSLNTMVASTW